MDSPPNFGSCHVFSRTDDLALLIGRVFHKLMNFWSFAASLGAKGVPYSNAPMKAVGEKERRHAPSTRVRHRASSSIKY